MDRVVLQIPMSKSLRTKAEKSAAAMGFSSLQETVRVFLKRLADKAIEITFKEEEAVQLSPQAIARYNKILNDIEKGKNVYHAKDVNDLFKHLDKWKFPRLLNSKRIIKSVLLIHQN